MNLPAGVAAAGMGLKVAKCLDAYAVGFISRADDMEKGLGGISCGKWKYPGPIQEMSSFQKGSAREWWGWEASGARSDTVGSVARALISEKWAMRVV